MNVSGTENVLRAARDAGVRRVVFISSTAVYGVPEKHPIEEDDPLVGVGWYGESKIDAEALCRVAAVETTIVRPKTFIGPERLGVFEILFDWIREGRRIYILGKGHNRYQLLGVEDLVDAIVRAATVPEAARETFNVGATEFATVRSDLQALIDHAGSSSRLTPVPVKPAELALRALELMKLSPLAEWHYKTAHKDSFVDVSKAQRLLGWQPRLSNRDALIETYDWYLANRGRVGAAGVTHRVPWNQQALGAAEEAVVIFLSQAEVRELLDLDALVDALADAHAELSAGKASMPPRIAALVQQQEGTARRDAVLSPVDWSRVQARLAVPAQQGSPYAPGGHLRVRSGQRHTARTDGRGVHHCDAHSRGLDARDAAACA